MTVYIDSFCVALRPCHLQAHQAVSGIQLPKTLQKCNVFRRFVTFFCAAFMANLGHRQPADRGCTKFSKGKQAEQQQFHVCVASQWSVPSLHQQYILRPTPHLNFLASPLSLSFCLIFFQGWGQNPGPCTDHDMFPHWAVPQPA